MKVIVSESYLKKIIREATKTRGKLGRLGKSGIESFEDIGSDSVEYDFKIKGTGSSKEYKGEFVKNKSKFNSIDPFALSKLKPFIEELKSKNYRILITSGYRTATQQQRIKSSGVGMATATSGYSPHNFGLAIDMNFFKPDGQLVNSKADRSEWKIIADLCKKHKLTWGGTFSEYDPVHVDVYPQLGLGNNRNTIANKLRKAADAFIKDNPGKKEVMYSDFKEYIGKDAKVSKEDKKEKESK